VRLLSHPERFFEAFSALAERVAGAAELLRDLLVDPSRAGDLLARMTVLDHEAAELRRQVLAEGAAVPVAPLPREDVHQVTSLLGDLVSTLQDAARRTQSLHLDTPREPASRLADVVVRAARCIQASVASFRERNFIAERCGDMEPLAHEGQAIYDSAVEAIFAGAPDPVEVIRWKEVYDLLEHTIQQCKTVENALSSIVLENRD
jgi:uncharacterized protein